MPQPLTEGLDRVRQAILDPETLVRAVAAGRRRGTSPPFRRVELRYVDLRRGRCLQITEYDERQSHIRNEPVASAAAAVDALLDTHYANWHVQSRHVELQLRVTKRGDAQVHEQVVDAAHSAPVDTTHDRAKARMLPVSHPVWQAVGLADADGKIKPSRVRKHRQVEEFLALLGPRVTDLLASDGFEPTSEERPLRIVDLGCGNGYLTFAAYAYLTSVCGWPTRLCGVDVRPDSRDRNTATVSELGWSTGMTFVAGANADADVDAVLAGPPDVVLALHACDTATDEALARAVRWQAPLVLAAPCCHHDLQRQLRTATTPHPYRPLVRDGILRERFADVLTDAFRASVLSMLGYRVDVVQFVESQHTPRNTMIRALRLDPPRLDPLRLDPPRLDPPHVGTGQHDRAESQSAEYVALRDSWGVTPALEAMLRPELDPLVGPRVES